MAAGIHPPPAAGRRNSCLIVGASNPRCAHSRGEARNYSPAGWPVNVLPVPGVVQRLQAFLERRALSIRSRSGFNVAPGLGVEDDARVWAWE
jgi:hypothetical protein